MTSVLEGYEEHAVVKQLLSELDELSKDDETWGAKLKVLQENVEHHVEEEEGEMFPSARKVLSAERGRGTWRTTCSCQGGRQGRSRRLIVE